MPSFLLPEDPDVKIGNLGYKGRIGAFGLVGTTQEYRRFVRGKQPRPGIVVALHTTLQDHCQLEYPSGAKEMFDTQGAYDAGEVIWTKSENARAIIKNLKTNAHTELELLGVTTRGFCLLVLPGLTEPEWCWPQEPRMAGGRARPFYYRSEEEFHQDFSAIALESFTLDRGLLVEYRDITGITIPISPAQRSQKSHKERLGPGL